MYAPGPRDPDVLARFVADAGAPTNALIGVGSSLTMQQAADIGIRRVSVGGSLYRATMSAFRQLVEQMVSTGSFATDLPRLGSADLEDRFR